MWHFIHHDKSPQRSPQSEEHEDVNMLQLSSFLDAEGHIVCIAVAMAGDQACSSTQQMKPHALYSNMALPAREDRIKGRRERCISHNRGTGSARQGTSDTELPSAVRTQLAADPGETLYKQKLWSLTPSRKYPTIYGLRRKGNVVVWSVDSARSGSPNCPESSKIWR